MSFSLLDLGTARTTLLQVRILDDGHLQYAGHATVPSGGMRKGLVQSLPLAVEAIRSAALQLEQLTSTPVERVFLSLTGPNVKGLGSQAGLALTSRSREVTRDDARRVLELARSIELPDGREIIHVIPQEFVLDHQPGIHEPVGMLASRLEARVYAITVDAPAKNNLVLAANTAGLEVEELIFAPLAVAEACLRAEDRHAGVALVELGAGSTQILIYQQGSLAHAAVIPVGGDHFTNDIAAGLATPHPDAERIKCGFGAATAAHAAPSSSIEVPSLGDRPPRLLPLRQLCECIEPRARELTRLIQTEVAKAGPLASGIVLGGGASRLPGLQDMLAAALPTRLANPALIDGMPDFFADPDYGFCVGACYYAHRLVARRLRPPTLWEKLKSKWDAMAQ